MMASHTSVEKCVSKTSAIASTPSPSDFDEFLPWACHQFQLNFSVQIIRVEQNEYVSIGRTDRSKKKKMKSQIEVSSDDTDDKNQPELMTFRPDANIFKIYTTYDTSDNLVNIKFDKNKTIPRILLKIIGLMVTFHLYLTSFTINDGLDGVSLHEICNILPKSTITDICLDGTLLEEANYCLLLENENKLRQISLARCKIDDDMLKKFADNLRCPLPSSKTLCVLNMTSNKITDAGAKYLADALKSNRHLAYLNLSDNKITDDGAVALLDVLCEFPITTEDVYCSRKRHMSYIVEKKENINLTVAELRNSQQLNKKKARRMSYTPKKNQKLEKEPSLKSIADTLDTALLEKAEAMVLKAMGPFTDAYSSSNIVSKDGIIYCQGNNTLAYLNLAYNDISYFTVKRLMDVLLYQKLMDRDPIGLMNVCIEGNLLPDTCMELTQVNEILEMGLITYARRNSVKKKPISRK